MTKENVPLGRNDKKINVFINKKVLMKKLNLNANWFLSGAQYENLPATVPGCVHTDLKNNNLIPDYFWRDNNDSCQWIENENWTYSCVFNFTDDTRFVNLVFEGLDTYSTIFLNGEEIGKTQNMFIPHTFNVSGKLKEKDNVLKVCFRSPIKEVETLPLNEAAFTAERLNTRRIQCTYYWDWVDRFVTAGIFAPVYFEIGNDFCVDNTYIYTQLIDDFGAQLNVTANFKNYEKSSVVKFEIIDPDGLTIYENSKFIKESQTVLLINVTSPKLWWPNGYGAHPIYTLRITAGENVYEEKFGIRTLRVAEIVDEKGGEYDLICQKLKQGQKRVVTPNDWDYTTDTAGFIVIVNGVRIYCRGGNWVPCEPFPSEESEEKIREIVALSEEANVNMIRVWGGGIFEKDAFYNECDKRGILVTQDFLMACGTYPQNEEWFLNELKKESAYAAIKLRNHPCLAWWSGDNENAVKGSDLKEDFNGRNASLIGLAPQVQALDYNRRYHISSPYGGAPYMAITRGTTHTTNFFLDVFKFFIESDCATYKEHLESFLARFIVEETNYGNPQKSTLLRFMTESDLYDESEKMLRHHSKSNPAVPTSLYDYGRTFAEKIFGGFNSVDDKLFKLEYVQFEWIRVVFENCRRNIGFNDGLVFWMLNDCWPASMGWSLIDYYNLPKSAWYSFKRCAKKVIGSIKKESDKYLLYVSSDGDSGNAKITCRTPLKNNVFTTTTYVKGYNSTVVELPLDITADLLICDVEFNGITDRCFYKDGILPLSKCEGVEIVSVTDSAVTLRANKYVHVVYLEGDYVFSNNYFSMLNGEEITLTYRKASINKNSTLFTLNAYTLSK